MDFEVFDDVCAPSFAEGGLGSRLDDSTDFFALRTGGDNLQKFDGVESPTINFDASNVSPKKAPLSNIPINSPVISEISKNETSNTKSDPASTTMTHSHINDGSELENLGRLAMFGNRPQTKRRSQLKRELERSKAESERKAPTMRAERPPAVRVPIPAPVPRDPSNARQSYSRAPIPTRSSAPRPPTSSRLSSSTRLSGSVRQPSVIRSRTPSVEPVRARRSVSVDRPVANQAKNIQPVAPRPILAGPITRSRARQSNEAEAEDTSNHPPANSLTKRLSQLQISKRPIAPLTSEQDFRKGIRQRNAIAPRLSSTPVGKLSVKAQEAVTSISKKPPLPVPSASRREGSVTRDRAIHAVKQSPVIVARSPMRRTPVAAPAQSRVAFGSGVRPPRVARRSNTASPGFRKYPANPTTRPLVVTIPDTPSFMRRLSSSKKDPTSVQHVETPSQTQPHQRQSSLRRSRIDVAQLVDRLSKPKVLSSPKRVPQLKSKIINGSTHGLTSQRKIRSRSTSIVRPGSVSNVTENNQSETTNV